MGEYSSINVVPSDTTDTPNGPLNQLVVGGAGNIKFASPTTGAANPVTLAVIAGQTLTMKISRVFATGTTATGLVGCY